MRSLYSKHRVEKDGETHLRDLTYPLHLYLATENAKTGGRAQRGRKGVMKHAIRKQRHQRKWMENVIKCNFDGKL